MRKIINLVDGDTLRIDAKGITVVTIEDREWVGNSGTFYDPLSQYRLVLPVVDSPLSSVWKCNYCKKANMSYTLECNSCGASR